MDGAPRGDRASDGGPRHQRIVASLIRHGADVNIPDHEGRTPLHHALSRGFTQIGAMGQFASGDARFFAAAGASGGHDADDRLIYNTTTGQLYYDADGNGAGAPELVATLQGAPSIAATDLWVI